VYVKIADRFNEAAVERDLLLGLAQRGRCRGRVIDFHLATRKRYLARMVREMTGTPREKNRRLRARDDRHEHSCCPELSHSSDCRHHSRITVVIIEIPYRRMRKRFRRMQ
jgi:hypothetical protein